jgi:hypothetical protein
MSRRRLLTGYVPLAGAAVLFSMWVVNYTRHMQITLENYERIENGMTKLEVEAILGKPDYAPGEGQEARKSTRFTMASAMMREAGHLWRSEDLGIYVRFDETGKVAGRMWEKHERQALTERFRRWLHLPWW